MYDNTGACSYNRCCSGNATVLSVCVVSLAVTKKYLVLHNSALMANLCDGQKYSVCSLHTVTDAD
jgi:hypothetical protein